MNGNNEKKNKRGLIIGLFFMLCEKIYGIFTSGLIFGAFGSDSKLQGSFNRSGTAYCAKLLKKKTHKFFVRMRLAISRQFEGSLFLRIISKLYVYLLSLPGRVVSVFTLIWSIYATSIAIIKHYVLQDTDGMISAVVCGIIVFFASLVLLFTEKNISSLCEESGIVSSFLRSVVGVSDESFKTRKVSKSAQSTAVILGIFFGTMTYFIHPIYMLLTPAAFILLSLIFAYPESGVVISLALAPLMGIIPFPSAALAGLVLLTLFSYVIKVIRGKRVFSVNLTELAVYAFMTSVLLGAFAPGECNTGETALMTLSMMLIFPLTVNLMKYKHWIKTCLAAFILPSAIIAIVGVFQYLLGSAPAGWTDTVMFSGISGRTVSLFNNPNILGHYLVMIFPLSLMLMLKRNSASIRKLGAIISVSIILCTAFTFSRSAWLALVVGGLVFALWITPRGILWLIPGAAAAFTAALIFPDSFGMRLRNFFSIADSANSYRVSVWNSSWDLLSNVFTGGIGMGEEAFKTAHSGFADLGAQSVVHSHSLYMQLAIQLGIVGLLMFVIAMVLIGVKASSAVSEIDSDSDLKYVIKATMAGAVALLVAGFFDYTWYNYRLIFVFWALTALACASANISNRECRRIITAENDEMSAAVTVTIPKTSMLRKFKKSEENDNE